MTTMFKTDLEERLLSAEERLEVTREYLQALSERDAYMRTWEHAKAEHKERLEEMNERIGDLLDSMRSGIARPMQRELELDGDDELLARVDAHLAACDEERAKSIERIPMPGPADVEEQAEEIQSEVRAAEWPGEIAPGEASDDPKYWDAKKLEALGGIDPAAAVRDFGYGKRWCVKAEMSEAFQADRGWAPWLAAYHMGAHAKAAKMKLHQNPFLNTNTDEAGRFEAWACGWNAVAALNTRIASASLNAADARSGVVVQAEEAEEAVETSEAPVERDDRIGTEFEGDARVNHNGVFDPLCVSVHLPALTFKKFKARLESVEVSPGRWTYGYDITHAEGGVSGPATIHGPWFADMAAVVKDFEERLERSTPRLIANNDAFQKVFREWVAATLEACAGKAVAA